HRGGDLLRQRGFGGGDVAAALALRSQPVALAPQAELVAAQAGVEVGEEVGRAHGRGGRARVARRGEVYWMSPSRRSLDGPAGSAATGTAPVADRPLRPCCATGGCPSIPPAPAPRRAR